MKKTHYRSRIAAWFLSALFMFSIAAVPAAGFAQITDTNGFGLESTFNTIAVKSEQTDVKAIAASIVNIVLGFLGIIAVIIILAGAFKWMTAGGNEDKVGEARKMIVQGVIGLVIIFAAWAIATFVITQLGIATGIETDATTTP